jgi:hypothetical protein
MATRGLDFGFPSPARPRGSLGGGSSSEPITDFRAEYIEFLETQIREKQEALECPICLQPASAPIYACPESHVICTSCLPKLVLKAAAGVVRCGVCRADLVTQSMGQVSSWPPGSSSCSSLCRLR